MFSDFPVIYTDFFTTILNSVRRINNNGNDPDGFLVDFELAAINAIQNVLPGSQVSGCFYHLSSSLWKHIQRAGLQEQYVVDPQFALHLRMIAAVAFVPPQDIENAYIHVSTLIRNRYPGQIAGGVQQGGMESSHELRSIFI